VLRPALTLSLCLFANQSATLVLSPILVEVARDFEVSTATAGQLRTISGAVAAAAALAVGLLAGRLGLRRLLLSGLAILAAACGLSAAAPTFAVLAAAQALLGVGLAVLLAGAVAGATAWTEPSRRADALSLVFSGQAAAWVVGMPLIGVVGELTWRLSWVVVPLGAALLAFVLTASLPPVRTPAAPTSLAQDLALLRRNATLRAWALGEVLAFAGWAGMLVFSGALLIESYDLSLGAVGLLLGLAATAYFPGSFLFRRYVDRAASRLIVALALAAAVVATLVGTVRPGVAATVGLLALYMFLNSGRTMAGSAFGLDAAPGRAATTMGIRASATQLGYLIGSGLGGVALHLGGYPALGATFGSLFALAVVPHALLALRARPARLAS